jgi:hypothetical protein
MAADPHFWNCSAQLIQSTWRFGGMVRHRGFDLTTFSTDSHITAIQDVLLALIFRSVSIIMGLPFGEEEGGRELVQLGYTRQAACTRLVSTVDSIRIPVGRWRDGALFTLLL